MVNERQIIKTVVVTLANGKKVSMSGTEAERAGIELPPPPPPPAPGFPPPPPPPPPAMPQSGDWINVDASQKITGVVNGVPLNGELKEVKIKGNVFNDPATNPLVVIDGEISTTHQLNLINPATIQSVHVLKGKAAADKYSGQNTANGVIEIELKSSPTITKKEGVYNFKADDIIADDKKLDEIVAVGYRKENSPLKEVTIEGTYSNRFYIGVNNIIKVPNAPAGMKVFVSNGKVSKQNDHWIVQIPSPCEATVTLISADGKTLNTYYFNATYLPDNFKGNLSHVLYTQDHTLIFTKVEVEPSFPGGAEAWKKYLMLNVNASIPIDEGWKEGTYPVIVRFIVNTDGSINEVTTENYKGSKTAQSCIDLIKKGPRWIPAKQNGKTVTAYRKQPITFVVAKN